MSLPQENGWRPHCHPLKETQQRRNWRYISFYACDYWFWFSVTFCCRVRSWSGDLYVPLLFKRILRIVEFDLFFRGQHPNIVIIDEVIIQEKRIQAPSAFADSIFLGLRQNRTFEEAIFLHFHFLIIHRRRLLVADSVSLCSAAQSTWWVISKKNKTFLSIYDVSHP